MVILNGAVMKDGEQNECKKAISEGHRQSVTKRV